MSTQVKTPSVSTMLLIGFMGLVRKEFNRFLRIWPQSLLPSSITMVLYFLIFGKVIGSRIGLMEGVSYMQFIIPGLIMMPIITNSYSNVVSSFFGARFNKSIEELLVSPMPNWMIITGFMAGGVGRGLIVGAIGLIVSGLFEGFHVAHPVLLVVTALFASMLFSLTGFLNGTFARNFDDTSIVTTFVLTPLIYLGGVFYSINLLPPFWRDVSMFNPIHYFIDIFRYSLIGKSGVHVEFSMAVIVILTVALFVINLICMRKGFGVKA